MKLRTIVAGAMLATAALAGPAVHAQAVRNLSHLVLIPDNAGGYSATFGDIFTASQRGSSFLDTFTFTVDRPETFAITGSLTTLNLYMDPPENGAEQMIKSVWIRDFGLFSYDPATGATGPELSVNNTPYGHEGFDGAWHLNPGTYAVQVRGDVLGNFGGSYAGDVAIMPVPEPQTWGMLLAGLATVGALARRRKAG